MTVFPERRLAELKAAMASSRVETVPIFVRSRPSRTGSNQAPGIAILSEVSAKDLGRLGSALIMN